MKKAQHCRIDSFKLCCWRRLLRASWTARRPNQSILKGILNIYWEACCWSSSIWPPDVKNWLIGKHPDAGKNWGQEEKVATEDEMVRWHHWFDGHEFEQTQGDRDGQRSLAAVHGVAKKWTQFSDWTTPPKEIKSLFHYFISYIFNW